MRAVGSSIGTGAKATARGLKGFATVTGRASRATVRQARRTYEPDPVWAAVEAHLGGADGITVHLREDRRHIQDEDVRRLRELTHIKLNLEMAATDEMVGIAARLKPEMAMLVPEGRHEITTEGGLDVALQEKALKEKVSRLAGSGIVVSVFIDNELQRTSNLHDQNNGGAAIHHASSSSSPSPPFPIFNFGHTSRLCSLRLRFKTVLVVSQFHFRRLLSSIVFSKHLPRRRFLRRNRSHLVRRKR